MDTKVSKFAFYSAAGLQAIATVNLLAGMACTGVIDGALVTVWLVAGSTTGAGYWLPNDNAISNLTWQQLT